MYLEQVDIEQGIYPEILQVLTRNPENIATAINDAVIEVTAYLSGRYDMDTELAKTGSARNTLVVKLIREIAIYNCYTISNPMNMPEIRISIYKSTISFLKDIQSEKADVPGLILLADENGLSGSNIILSGGNTRRNNRY